MDERPGTKPATTMASTFTPQDLQRDFGKPIFADVYKHYMLHQQQQQQQQQQAGNVTGAGDGAPLPPTLSRSASSQSTGSGSVMHSLAASARGISPVDTAATVSGAPSQISLQTLQQMYVQTTNAERKLRASIVKQLLLQQQQQQQESAALGQYDAVATSSGNNTHSVAPFARAACVLASQADDTQSQASHSSGMSSTTSRGSVGSLHDALRNGSPPPFAKSASQSSFDAAGMGRHFDQTAALQQFFLSPAAGPMPSIEAAASLPTPPGSAAGQAARESPSQLAPPHASQLSTTIANLMALSGGLADHQAIAASLGLLNSHGTKRSFFADFDDRTTPLDTHSQAGSLATTSLSRNASEIEAGLASFPKVRRVEGPAAAAASKSSISDDQDADASGYKKRRKRRRIKPWSSRYQGVSWHKRDKRWVARIWVEGKTQNLGTFLNEEHAALVVDRRVIRVFGEDGGGMPLNIPDRKDRHRLALEFGLPDPNI